MTEVLANKYRPATFDEVVGQNSVVASLRDRVKRNDAHAFVFSGPSGTGKTTLARIVAAELGTEPKDLLEVNAASKTGIDDMRAVMETLQYKPFGKSDSRAIIIDEAHRLSRPAWDSMLKSVEEPPDHVYWFFCTTEEGKVPTTIKTRCASYKLKPVSDEDLGVLFDDICKLEKIKLPAGVGDLVIREALGSPRQMLANLGACRNVKDRKAAADLLRTAAEADPIRELAGFLLKGGGSWAKAMTIFEKFDGEEPESVRIVICIYMAAVVRNATKEQQAAHALNLLDNFSQPYNPSEKNAPLLLSIGRCIFNAAD